MREGWRERRETEAKAIAAQSQQVSLNEDKCEITNETLEEIQTDHNLSKSSEGTHGPPPPTTHIQAKLIIQPNIMKKQTKFEGLMPNMITEVACNFFLTMNVKYLKIY